MLIISGTGMYGKVDQVPGLFHVETQFFHIQLVPLVPVGSYLIFDKKGLTPRVPIRLQGRSVLFTYARLGLLLGAGGAVAAALLEIGHRWQTSVTWLVLAGALFFLLIASYRYSRAGPSRALRLAEQVGMHMEVLAEHFASLDPPKSVDAIADAEPVDDWQRNL
jgi:hypothetical protein